MVHLALAAAVALSFGSAPFHHFHGGDPDHVHAHGMAHGHWMHPPAAPEWEPGEEDSDARYLEWLANDGPVGNQALIPVRMGVVPDAMAPGERANVAPAPRNHDPPWRAAIPARAPPQ